LTTSFQRSRDPSDYSSYTIITTHRINGYCYLFIVLAQVIQLSWHPNT
jgi:hypothetical protein